MTFEGIFKYEEPDKIGKIYIGLIKEDGKESVVIKCVETYEKMDNEGSDRIDSARIVIPRDLFEKYFTIICQV